MYILGNIAIERRYRLRWRFDFAGKPTRRGIWNNAGGSQACKETSAWSISKTGLVRASIEGELHGVWTVHTLAEIDGHDFANFRWLAATPAPMSTGDLLGKTLTLVGQTVGLAIDGRELSHIVYVDGTRATETRTAADKAINLAGF